MMRLPHGEAEVRATYGDIEVIGGKVVAPPHWERDNMLLLKAVPGYHRPLFVHKLIAEPLVEVLEACVKLADGYEIRTLGCFNPRRKRGGSGRLSMHSWGAAFDLNESTNPYGAPFRCDIPVAWRAILGRRFHWLGEATIPDTMHWQAAKNY